MSENLDPKTKVCSGLEYNDLFDPSDYLEGQYSALVKGESTALETTTIMDIFHNIFSKGYIKGQRLLDVGTGPSIINLISVSRFFEEIYLSDLSVRNRTALTTWLKKRENSWNWEPFFRYVAKLQGNENSWGLMQEDLRSKIKDIYFCDVNQANPLNPVQTDQFDAITSSYCIETACSDVDSYQQALKNVVTLLKPKGHLVLLGGLNETRYRVGDIDWATVSLQEEHYRKIWEAAGLEMTLLYPIDRPKDVEDCESDYTGIVIIVARKK